MCPVIAVAVGLFGVAFGWDLEGLSFSGDGQSPSVLARWDEANRSLGAPRGGGGVNSGGGATWSSPLDLPPALLSPSVVVGLNSEGGPHSRLGRGFQLSGWIDIHRAVGREANATRDLGEVFVVSGGGLDGLIVADGPGWRFVSVNPGSALVERDGDVWTIGHDGVWTELDAIDVNRWRPIEAWDAFGNAVRWTWTGSRLDQVSYGGTTEPGGDALVEVLFAYRPALSPSLQGGGGAVDLIDERLDRVEIHSRADALGAWVHGVNYVVEWTEHEGGVGVLGEELISALVVEDPASVGPVPDRLAIAEFSWTRNTMGALVTVADITGDGILDYVGQGMRWSTGLWESATGPILEWERLEVDEDGNPTASAPRESTAGSTNLGFWPSANPPLGPEVEADRSWSVAVAYVESGDNAHPSKMEEIRHASFSESRLVDVDGDGFLDIVESGGPAQGISSGNTNTMAYNLFGDNSNEWTIWYGAGSGNFKESRTVGAPFQYSRILQRDPLLNYDCDEVAYEWVVLPDDDESVDLFDLNGDGWQDIVVSEADLGAQVAVYLHPGGRDAGWPAVPSLWVDGAWNQRSGLLECLGDTWDQDFVRVAEERRIAGFLDINGDGIPDRVDASGWTEGAPTWNVWLGDGVGWEADPRLWPSPVGWIEATVDANPQRSSCNIPSPSLESYVAYVPSPLEFYAGFDFFDANTLLPAADLVVDVSFSGMPVDVQVPGTCYVYSWTEFPAAANSSSGLFEDFFLGDSEDVPLRDSMVQGAWDEIEPGHAPCHQSGGSIGYVSGALLDVDADGRMDLFDGEAAFWYRNYGTGFDAGRPLPPHLPLTLSLSVSFQVVTQVDPHMDELGWDLFQVDLWADGLLWNNGTSTTEIQRVADFNGDGSLDVATQLEEASLVYGPGTRPFLIEKITIGTGAERTFAWGNSARDWPGGAVGGGGIAYSCDGEYCPIVFTRHEDPSPRPVVSETIVEDPSTGYAHRTTYVREQPKSVDGRWWGFASTFVDDWRWTPEAPYWTWTGSNATTTLLAALGSVPTQSDIHIDPLAPSGPVDLLAESVESTWTDAGGLADFPVWWPDSRVVTVWPEDPAAVARVVTTEVDFDAFGNPLVVSVSDPDRPQDDVEVTATWLPAIDAAPAFGFVLDAMETHAADPVAPYAWALVESGSQTYEPVGELDRGKVVAQVVASGPLAALASETLSWMFGYSPRGALASRVGPVDSMAPGAVVPEWEATSFGFGESVVTSGVNALGHATSRTLDERGRVVTETDANGVVVASSLDAFGRLVQRSRALAGVPAPGDLLSTWVYQDESVPNVIEEHRYRVDAEGVSAVVAYSVLDGFGDGLQHWEPDETDVAWIVAEGISDVLGRVVRTTQPHRESSWTGTLGPYGSQNESEQDTDALGLLRRAWSSSGGDVTWTYPSPGESTSEDELGLVRTERRDGLGRLYEVVEGSDVVATYAFDGRGRVRTFVDAAGNRYQWDCDGAGRRRTVWRRGAADLADVLWRSFAYAGAFPSSEHGPSGELLSSWTWDSVGRTTGKTVSNGVGGFHGTTWAWDSEWIGALSGVTDPWGHTDYSYAGVDLGGGLIGGDGLPTDISRTWTDGTVASVVTERDRYGRELSRTTPSGVDVASSYSASGRLLGQDLTWATGSWSVASSFDAFGLHSGWSATRPMGDSLTLEVERSDPAAVSSLAWSSEQWTKTIDYDHSANGSLANKVISGVGTLAYNYDDRGRIVEAIRDGTPAETYVYDVLSNPEEVMLEHEGGWVYDPVPRFSEVSRRVNGLNTDTHSWDAAGRMRKWTSSFALTSGSKVNERSYTYDGSGRLLKVVHKKNTAPNSAPTVVTRTANFGYDANDALVWEDHGSAGKVWRFGGWEKDTRRVAAPQIDVVLPWLRVLPGASSDQRVVLAEPDGRAVWTLDEDLQELSHEVVGAYGVPIALMSAGPPWEMDGIHGSDPDRELRLVHRGVRHALLRDGVWMGAEPLLALGLTEDLERAPAGMLGVYAVANTNRWEDPSGETPNLTLSEIAYVATRGNTVSIDQPTAEEWLQAAAFVLIAGPLNELSGTANAPGPDSVLVRDSVLKDISLAATVAGVKLGPGGAGTQLNRLMDGVPGASEAIQVSRWGRSGLEAGDWVMRGGATRWNYFWSGKWQPGFGNEFAPLSSGQTFRVPPSTLQWPQGFGPDGFVKGLLGQRRYVPTPALPPPPPLLPPPGAPPITPAP